MVSVKPPYFWCLTLATDMWFNALFGGWPGETISSRCGRLYKTNQLARIVYDTLDWIRYRHCERAMAAIKQEDYIPPSERIAQLHE